MTSIPTRVPLGTATLVPAQRLKPGPGLRLLARIDRRLQKAFRIIDQPADEPVDLPHDDAEECRKALSLAPSGVKPGKGVHDADSAWQSNVTSIDALRARKKICHHCRTRPAACVIRFRDGGGPVLLCADCRPVGVLGVVEGGEPA